MVLPSLKYIWTQYYHKCFLSFCINPLCKVPPYGCCCACCYCYCCWWWWCCGPEWCCIYCCFWVWVLSDQKGYLHLCEVPFICSTSYCNSCRLAQTVPALCGRVLHTLYLAIWLWWLFHWHWFVWVSFLYTIIISEFQVQVKLRCPKIIWINQCWVSLHWIVCEGQWSWCTVGTDSCVLPFAWQRCNLHT